MSEIEATVIVAIVIGTSENLLGLLITEMKRHTTIQMRCDSVHADAKFSRLKIALCEHCDCEDGILELFTVIHGCTWQVAVTSVMASVRT